MQNFLYPFGTTIKLLDGIVTLVLNLNLTVVRKMKLPMLDSVVDDFKRSKSARVERIISLVVFALLFFVTVWSILSWC